MTMTTPEALRHRQYRLGVAMVLLGCLTVVWGIVLEVQNISQRHCLQDNLGQLNTAFSARADLNDSRNKLITEQSSVRDQRIEAQSQLIRSVSTATTTAQFQQAFKVFDRIDNELSMQGADISQQLDTLNKEIAQTKVPDFPEGKCS